MRGEIEAGPLEAAPHKGNKAAKVPLYWAGQVCSGLSSQILGGFFIPS